MSEAQKAPVARRARITAILIVGASGAMLGLTFAAVPLYRLFCAATGYGGTPQIAEAAPAVKGQRQLTVHFDANVAPGLHWTFKPETNEIKLRTGETATIFYQVTNQTDQPSKALATYNVTPGPAGAFFSKINCFCFDQQSLGPRQTAELPVVFFLDPALEKDATMAEVSSITLSYTFFPARSEASAGAETSVAAVVAKNSAGVSRAAATATIPQGNR
jgi:cytochrome c oxidase assembly protein subunit 11